MPDGSSNRENSSMFKHQAQPNCPQSGDSLLPLPSVVDRDTLRQEDINDAGQLAVEMQVSVLIHLQDPVELLPHVVNIDAD